MHAAGRRSAPSLSVPTRDESTTTLDFIGMYEGSDASVQGVADLETRMSQTFLGQPLFDGGPDLTLSRPGEGRPRLSADEREALLARYNPANKLFTSPLALSSAAQLGDERPDALRKTRSSKILTMSARSSSRRGKSRPRVPIAPVSDVRDRYGFRKQSQYVTLAEYDEWYAKYERHLARRKKKWEAFMKDSGIAIGPEGPAAFPAKSKKAKRYIRKGIPAEWRGAAWFWYARGHEHLAANPGRYEQLWQKGVLGPTPDAELIERDLHRTFPDNVYFRSDKTAEAERAKLGRRASGVQPETPILQALRRVLLAFALYSPKIGYCQSLNFLAGLLLLFMEEEKAFWMLVIITQRYLPGMHEVNLEGANIDQGVLMMCVKESLPAVWLKIGAGLDGAHYDDMITRLPPITLCTAAWFMSGFIGVLPIESVIRVWDCFFYEDSKVFFRMALTILKLGEDQIESVRDSMEIFQVVQTIPKRLLDATELMQACFRRRNGFGHISQDEVNERRKFVADRRKRATDAAPLTASSRTSSFARGLDPAAASRYQHYDAIAGAYNGKGNIGKKIQMFKLGNSLLSPVDR
ncbi:carabin [Dipodascopsis tothii]|uniref:carabin n=1 Tax=Dipodascopsis tothii TaxID=44089 RepID=UPI0034CD187A